MSRSRIMDIVMLTRAGWRPYNAVPDMSVYEKLDCTAVLGGRKHRPILFVRDDVFCCVGCAVHCSLKRPK